MSAILKIVLNESCEHKRKRESFDRKQSNISFCPHRDKDALPPELISHIVYFLVHDSQNETDQLGVNIKPPWSSVHGFSLASRTFRHLPRKLVSATLHHSLGRRHLQGHPDVPRHIRLGKVRHQLQYLILVIDRTPESYTACKSQARPGRTTGRQTA
ncbi:hypothetical protein CPB85DRAFT_966012 [Mucidula mucida]|nr:hypothetical protein CPB85DRAFT_966012 [Mucidula mucida]